MMKAYLDSDFAVALMAFELVLALVYVLHLH